MFDKKRDEKINEINGVNKLNEELRAKYLKLFASRSNANVNDVLAWEEFREIFITTTFMYSFQKKDIIFSIFNCGSYAEFWIDGEDKDSYQKYETSIQLLEGVRIDGKTIKEIWNELTVCG